MENQTTFDLNLAIRRWREDLARSSAMRIENLDELESHLRDSIDRLRAHELSEEEAFLVATLRLGKVQKLEQEFRKVNGSGASLERTLWVFIAVQLWLFVSCSCTTLVSTAMQSAGDSSEILTLVLVMVFSPIPAAIVVVLVALYLIWFKRTGSSRFLKFLGQPAGMALTLFILGALFTFASTWALQAWYYPIIAQHASYRQDTQMRLFCLRLPSLALCAVVTFLVAHRRLRGRWPDLDKLVNLWKTKPHLT